MSDLPHGDSVAELAAKLRAAGVLELETVGFRIVLSPTPGGDITAAQGPPDERSEFDKTRDALFPPDAMSAGR